MRADAANADICGWRLPEVFGYGDVGQAVLANDIVFVVLHVGLPLAAPDRSRRAGIAWIALWANIAPQTLLAPIAFPAWVARQTLPTGIALRCQLIPGGGRRLRIQAGGNGDVRRTTVRDAIADCIERGRNPMRHASSCLAPFESAPCGSSTSFTFHLRGYDFRADTIPVLGVRRAITRYSFPRRIGGVAIPDPRRITRVDVSHRKTSYGPGGPCSPALPAAPTQPRAARS